MPYGSRKTTSLVCTGFICLLIAGSAVQAGEIDAAAKLRIEQAIPAKSPVQPIKPRRLLIFDLNVVYGGHGSIPFANYAFTQMGRKTGAYETVVSRDPAVFKQESLKTFDAVFFNNTVGNLFEDPQLRQNLLEFVQGGGGLMGVHGTSVAFTRWPGAVENWPEFGAMLGTRGANHREADEQVFIKLDDPEHPLNRVFGGKGFAYRDEFFRPNHVFSPDKVRVLLSIDAAKSGDSGECPLAWVRSYGQGRVFYCSIAHDPSTFWNPTMLAFYLGAAQFVLGDLPATTTPSAKLSPTVHDQK